MKFRLLKAEEIDARVSTVSKKGCSILLYKDARCDMNILDETIGVENWQRKHELINGNLFCSVGVFISERGEWVWKQDVGTESYTEKEKGQASDSFKRACFNLGIGRELYTAPFIWFNANECNLSDNQNGKPTTNDRFEVVEINYDGRKIHNVTIRNTKTDVVKTFGKAGKKKSKPANVISKEEAEELRSLVSHSEFGSRSVLTHYGVDDFTELSVEQAKELRGKIGD